MATTVARLEAILTANTDAFDRKLKKSDSTMQKTGKVAGAMGLAMAAGIAFGTKRAINDASNLNEQMNKTLVVFGKSGKGVQVWSKGLTRDFGISSRAALEAAGTFGNMLVPMGLARPLAARMSKQMVQLAGDMSSFNNASPEETLEAIRSGLAGETEPLRKFGVFLSQDAIKAEALSEGIVKASVSLADIHLRQSAVAESRQKLTEITAKYGKGSVEATKAQAQFEVAEQKLHQALAGKVPMLTAAQKATATYGLITKDTKDAQGDFARTSGGLANQQRILHAEMENLSAELGAHLLPAVIKVMGAILNGTKFLQQHKTATKALAVAVVALTAALVAASAAQIAMNLAVLANPYVAATVAIIALAGGVALLYARFQQLRPVIEFWLETLIGVPLPLRIIITALGGVRETLNKIHGPIMKFADAFHTVYNWISKVVSAFQWLIDNAKKVTGVFGAIGGAAGKIIPHGDISALDMKGMLGSANATIDSRLWPALGLGRSMGLDMISGYRPNATVRGSGAKSDHSYFPSKAIDMADSAPMMNRFARAVTALSGIDTVIYSPIGLWKAGVGWGPIRSAITKADHYSHVHVDTFDQGGWLKPGLTLAMNKTGKAERVVTAEGWKEATKNVMRTLWPLAQKFLVPGAPMPRTYFPKPGTDEELFVGATTTNPGGKVIDSKNRVVVWPRWMTQHAFIGKIEKNWRDAALQTMVHEWAHAFQSADTVRSEWKAEGGATAFARYVMPKIASLAGFSNYGNWGLSGDPYAPFVKRVKEQLGWKWILRDQFAGAKGGFQSYDRGGWLPTGYSLAYNGTGSPERVGGGATYVFNLPNYVGSKNELLSWLRKASAEFERGNGRPAFGAS